ncbi:MAG: sulfatase-like hydrolase/transferase [Planctomycetota bacterium]
MPVKNAICIVVDGLRASALGCYGNTWYSTPSIDRLAAESIVADWMWSDDPTLSGFYRSFWSGRPAFAAQTDAPTDEPPLPVLLAHAGCRSIGVTDEPALEMTGDDSDVAAAFDLYEAGDSNAPSSTLFTAAVERFVACSATDGSVDQSCLLWLHCGGMRKRWEAPIAWSAELLDEEDPAPAAFSTPPQRHITDDPDEILVHRAAYGAEVALLDRRIGELLDFLQDAGLDESTLILLVGARGFALGEHGCVGAGCQQLYSELLHVPCIVRVPEKTANGRIQRLALPADLPATLLHWFTASGSGREPSQQRPRWWGRSLLSDDRWTESASLPWVIARGENGEAAVRTPAWMLRRSAVTVPNAAHTVPETESRCELFVKPDDRWEANEISALRSDVAERLLGVLAASERRSPREMLAGFARLDADLIVPSG